MTSMFQASKQLQAIRKQLKQMDQQYRDGFKTDFQDNTSEANCNSDPGQNCVSDMSDQLTANEDTCSGSTDNHSQNESSNFQTFISEASIGHVGDFEHVESMLSTLIEDSQDDSQNIMPLSHELRQAITNMEDIEDVDNLIGNVISSVQIDSSYDEDLQCIEQAVACTINGTNEGYRKAIIEKNSTKDGTQSRGFTSKEEEQLWKKDRIKKDNHNIIERRRRYNINDRIKELATLLPPTTHPAMKLNKGSILKASVEYVKELKKDKEKLVSFEIKQKTMEAKYQKMLIRIFQLELKMKLYGLTEDMDRVQTKRKKRPRRRLCEIDAMVEDLMKQTLPATPKPNEKASTVSASRQSNTDTCIELPCPNASKAAKSGLRNFINKKLSFVNTDSTQFRSSPKICSGSNESAGGQSTCKTFEDQVRGNTDNSNVASPSPQQTESAEEMDHKDLHLMIPDQSETPKNDQLNYSLLHNTSNAELSLDQCNLLLDLFGSEHVTLLQTEGESGQQSGSVLSHGEEKYPSPVLSPVTLTTNMLEALLRKPDGEGTSSSSSSSETHSLESSTDSTGIK
uniref:Uncharacterized protein LOC111133713 n=1 Tax=Crassostrea virginica TaxID=6565 RepID=A0A8B8EEN7_CRAVI|nr:uncharacterized protein LOC111133713 [Crassostrea virginica]